jgi:hypothetical protein
MTNFAPAPSGSALNAAPRGAAALRPPARRAPGARHAGAAPARRAAPPRADAAAAPPPGLEARGPNMKALKDIQEIMDILPHRCAGVW